MKRVTKKDLENMIGLLNNHYPTPAGMKYGIDDAYGGYRLVLIDSHGGEVDIGNRTTAKDLYNALCIMRKTFDYLEG